MFDISGVHMICNIVNQSQSADEKADNNVVNNGTQASR